MRCKFYNKTGKFKTIGGIEFPHETFVTAEVTLDVYKEILKEGIFVSSAILSEAEQQIINAEKNLANTSHDIKIDSRGRKR